MLTAGDVSLYAVTSSWDAESVDYNQSVSAIGTAFYDPDNLDWYTDIDVTSIVQGWLDDPSSNYGFSLRSNAEGTNYSAKYFEGMYGVTAPQLIVTEPDPIANIILGLIDNGCPETGLHSYTLTAAGIGITTLSQFTIDGDVHQVFHSGEPSEWLDDGSALETDTTDSHVIFGNLRLPDLGGETWDYDTYPAGPPDKFTEETIDEYGFGTLNNYDDILAASDAYMRTGPPSDELETIDLMQIVVADGDGFSTDLIVLTSTDYNPATGKSTITTHDLTFSLDPLAAGDANGNGYVDADDAAILAQHWQQQSGVTWAMGDFNGDGKVNDIDVTLLAANWNSQSANVPEPGTLVLLVGMLLAVGLWRRK